MASDIRYWTKEFNVTGDISNPSVDPVPVPILTKGAGKLFGHMLSAKPEQDLLDVIHSKDTTKP